MSLCVMFAENGFAMDAVIHQDHILSIILFVLNTRKLHYIGDLLFIFSYLCIIKSRDEL